MTNADLRKRFCAAIRERIWPLLRAASFTEFTELTAWRRNVRTIDVVDIMTFKPQFGQPLYLGGGIYANAATFSLGVGTYYLDLHRLPWMGPVPERPLCGRGERMRGPRVHREIDIARSERFPTTIQSTIFYVDGEGRNLDSVIADAERALRERGLAWLDGSHDIAAYLSTAALPDAGLEIPLTEAEEAEFSGMSELQLAALAMPGYMPEGISDQVSRKFKELSDRAETSDHTGLDHSPNGDLLVGLLFGEGRIEEALQAQRERAEEKFGAETHPTDEEIAANPELKLDSASVKRTRNRTLKRGEEFRAREREHLRLLEELLRVVEH